MKLMQNELPTSHACWKKATHSHFGMWQTQINPELIGTFTSATFLTLLQRIYSTELSASKLMLEENRMLCQQASKDIFTLFP